MKVHTKLIKAFGALLIAALLFAALPAGEVKAATITVCADGCNYSTIQAAINAANPGDTIEVGPGTYIEGNGGAEALVLNVPNLTLKSTNGRDETIIDANGATTGVWVLANLGTVTFDGFTVQNFAQNGVVQSYTQRTGTAFRIWNSLVDSSNGYLRNGLQVAGDYSEVKNNIVYGAPMDDTWASTAIGVINVFKCCRERQYHPAR